MPSSFKPGDKFILEIGERQLDEYEIAGTDYYIKIYLLEKLTPYNPPVQSKQEKDEQNMQDVIIFINKMKTVFNLLPDEEIDLYNHMYNDMPTEEFIAWINKKYDQCTNS